MAIKRNNFNTNAVLRLIYPTIAKAMDTRYNQWKRMLSEFIQVRSESLFDIAPCDRIFYTDKDREALYAALNVDPNIVKAGLKETYYWNKNPFKPKQAKDDVTIVCLCIVRYFLLKKPFKENDLELALIYQAFSGKYYPSIHFGFFKLVAPSKYRHIMEYVVNYKLSNKYDLKAAGNVIGAVKNINSTWVVSYKKMLSTFDDEDITYVIQQLHTRLKSFMKNIANMYYEAYKDKEYITYDKDSLPEEGDSAMYHLTTNDSFRLQHYVEKTMERINTSQVDYAICQQASDNNVKAEEIKSIIEAILGVTSNIPKIKEYITLCIASFMEMDKTKDVNSIHFLYHCIKQRANIQNPTYLRMKDLIEEFLDDNSVGYRKRKHRIATKLSYQKAFSYYFGIVIIKANK